MQWFTSDWHFNHQTLSKGIRGKRFSTVKDHDEYIINQIIECTSPGDDLFFLGDLAWKWSSKDYEVFFTKLKRHKLRFHWILGNHDKLSIKSSCIVWKGAMKDIIINKTPLTLCHYPLIVYNRSHYNAINLHGHIHVNDSTYNKPEWGELIDCKILPGKRLNMNVEFWEYKPISIEQILEVAKDLPDNWDRIYKKIKKN